MIDMENLITWVQTNWYGVLEGVGYFILGAGVIVGFFNGPKAEKAKTVFGRILGLLRTIGIGTFKDEPGTLSVPGASDSGERVASTESA
jgi:hypothetical protein